MNSREFDGPIDDLLRQALQPFAEAPPPVRVWRRVRRKVSTAPFAWWSRLWSRLSVFDVIYAPPLPSQSYCIESEGRFLPSPFSGMIMKQVFNLRLTS
ncbi:MAG TPA: hypothetical protein PLH19_14325 [Anaerolineae bacterium]|nr:hypothetical protein [Anaerolineae bacterium]HQH39693.1 hypothetical protein [Anaerolineae bacterium]